MPQLRWVDLAGQRFGRLTAVESCAAVRSVDGWRCKCDCGNTIETVGHMLRRKRIRSCGCAAKTDPRPPLAERFMAKVDRSGGDDACWLWTGTRTPHGYGDVTRGTTSVRAHRLSYELHIGPIPDGLFVCHRCDVRHCVNPAHLWLGTNDENMADMMAKGRHVGGRGPRGMNHRHAKLSDDAVREIRERCHARRESQRSVARHFGVSQKTISDVVLGLGWKHV